MNMTVRDDPIIFVVLSLKNLKALGLSCGKVLNYDHHQQKKLLKMLLLISDNSLPKAQIKVKNLKQEKLIFLDLCMELQKSVKERLLTP